MFPIYTNDNFQQIHCSFFFVCPFRSKPTIAATAGCIEMSMQMRKVLHLANAWIHSIYVSIKYGHGWYYSSERPDLANMNVHSSFFLFMYICRLTLGYRVHIPILSSQNTPAERLKQQSKNFLDAFGFDL